MCVYVSISRSKIKSLNFFLCSLACAQSFRPLSLIENNKLDRPPVLVISHWALFPSDIWTGGFFCYGTILPSILLAVEAMHKRTKQAKDENLLAIDQAPEAKLPFMIICSAVDFRKQEASERKINFNCAYTPQIVRVPAQCLFEIHC